MKLTTLRHRTKMVFATSAAGLMLLGAAAPAVAQPSGADFAAEIEDLPRNEALRKLGVDNPESFTGPVSRLIPSRDGSVDSPYEQRAVRQLEQTTDPADNNVPFSSESATDAGGGPADIDREQVTTTGSAGGTEEGGLLGLFGGLFNLG